MSQILMSIQRHTLFFQLTNVLAQIAITYFLCYLIMQLRFRWQAVVAGLILIGHWALFVAFPGTEGPFASKTTNIGAVIDYFVFGRDNPGYWVSVNFITSTATTLFGVWTGQLLRSDRSQLRPEKCGHYGHRSCRVPRTGADHPSMEPYHQEDLHVVLYDLQHRLGAPDVARVFLGRRGEVLSPMDFSLDRARREFDLHLLGGYDASVDG